MIPMDEKVFKLLEKMYAELTGKIDGIGNELQELKTEVKQNSKDIQKVQTTLENDVKPNIKLALQGFVDTNEKLSTIEDKIDTIVDRVDRHDIKIQVIEGGKTSKKKCT
jgi:predicted RNase H-like nuclease (RuvC/YqgF family)